MSSVSTIVHISQVSFTYSASKEGIDPLTIFREVTVSLPPGIVGVIGNNGCGKTTFLRLLAKEITPDSGSIKIAGTLTYMPQNHAYSSNATVADALGISPTLNALNRIDNGEGTAEDFLLLDGRWDCLAQLEAYAHQLQFPLPHWNSPLSQINGGNVMLLALMGAFLQKSDILLLDEPSNNLDIPARSWLMQHIAAYQGNVVISSHDRELLDIVDYIVEIRNGAIHVHNGNYASFLHYQHLHTQAVEDRINEAEKELKRTQRSLQASIEKQQRAAKRIRANASHENLPKIIINTRKNSAEKSRGKIQTIHQGRIDDAQENLHHHRQALTPFRSMSPIFPEISLPAGKPLITAFNANTLYHQSWIFTPPGVHFSMIGAQKIVLTGNNGSGKTSLLHMIAGKIPLHHGQLITNTSTLCLISQQLNQLNPHLSVEENFSTLNPHYSPPMRRTILAHFLFRNTDAHKRVATLSGGELVRAHLACLLFQYPTPTLTLLDEPTNNLDIASSDHLAQALNAYKGGLIIVSHDQYFLHQLTIDRRWHIHDGILTDMSWEKD